MIKKQPVKQGQVLDLEIKSFGKQNDGIGRINNFVIIVKNDGSLELDSIIKARITSVGDKYAFAEVVK